MNKKWNYKKIGDVFKTYSGGTPLKSHKEYYIGGSIPWLLSGEVNQRRIAETKNFITKKGYENSSAKIFPKNTVLVAMYGATAGQVGILDIEATTNQAVCGILPCESIIPDFLYFYMLSIKDRLISQAVGNAQPNLSQLKIKNTHIPIPPLPEQQRIVEILDQSFAAIDQAIENTEQNLENIKFVFDNYLQSIFSRKNHGWEERKLSEIALIKGGKRVPKGYKLKTSPTNHPYIRVTDFNDYGSINLDDIHYIDDHVYEQIKRYTISTNDLYISIAGTIGKSGIIPKELEGANLTENACKLEFKVPINPKFIYYFTKSTLFMEQAGLNTRIAAMPKLALSRLGTIKLSIPMDLAEQNNYVKTLDEISTHIQQLQRYYNQKIEKLQELKQSILHKAFQGEL
jgi:type I restriction enzyme S subunit